jgi:aminopeptidase N
MEASMKKVLLLLIATLATQIGYAQSFTRQDSLRGTLNPMRACYDVVFYDLHVRIDFDKRTLKGTNQIRFRVVDAFDRMQVDLFENMKIDEVTADDGQKLPFTREGNAFFVTYPEKLPQGSQQTLVVHYSGKPREAVNPPWDGGFSWKKTTDGTPWLGVSCEGLGASVWWPNKDHLSDEPDSMRIVCEVPKPLFCVANGKLIGQTETEGNYQAFEWYVSYPINNYNVTLNVTKYEYFADTYTAADGDVLALNYYVLPANLDKARKQFQQVKPMLACYEKYFGKYPFWRDGFALVETPYLGMEHQSAIAYGNGYRNGYMGSDLSGTGVGQSFDYIIIHESGHEYWGNNISCKDHAEMWIHESFCTYSEALYIECMQGREKADQYLAGYMRSVYNDSPIIGPLGVNADGSNDMYFKGAVILHTFRNVLDNDPIWFDILKGLNQDFRHQTVSTEQIIAYINQKAGKDWTPFFDQYLRHRNPPILEYKIKKNKEGCDFSFRWKTDVSNFEMPIKIKSGSETLLIQPKADEMQTLHLAHLPEFLPKHYYIFLEEKH